MVNEFFMAINPPTKTYQEKKVKIVNGKPVFYEPQDLKNVRAKLMAHLLEHRPEIPATYGVRLVAKWCFFTSDKSKQGKYRITKPDTDNLQKLLKDCMTDAGFWKNDALVASEICEKFWAEIPGIYIKVEKL